MLRKILLPTMLAIAVSACGDDDCETEVIRDTSGREYCLPAKGSNKEICIPSPDTSHGLARVCAPMASSCTSVNTLGMHVYAHEGYYIGCVCYAPELAGECDGVVYDIYPEY